jgi:hypothetical protein
MTGTEPLPCQRNGPDQFGQAPDGVAGPASRQRRQFDNVGRRGPSRVQAAVDRHVGKKAICQSGHMLPRGFREVDSPQPVSQGHRNRRQRVRRHNPVHATQIHRRLGIGVAPLPRRPRLCEGYSIPHVSWDIRSHIGGRRN